MIVLILAEEADRASANRVAGLCATNRLPALVYTPASLTTPDLQRADVVVVVCSTASLGSAWLQEKGKNADALGKPLVLVAVRGLDAAALGGEEFAWIDDEEGVIAIVRAALRGDVTGAGRDQPMATMEEVKEEALLPAPRPPPLPAAPIAAPAPAAASAPAPTTAAINTKPELQPQPSSGGEMPIAATLRETARPSSSIGGEVMASLAGHPHGRALTELIRKRGRVNRTLKAPQLSAELGTPEAPAASAGAGNETQLIERARAAPRSKGSSVGGTVSGLAVLVVAGGLAYAFRDKLAEILPELAKHADKLLAVLGFAKGALPPLPAMSAPTQAIADLVDCSVFAPPSVEKGERFMVQVFLHLIEQEERVAFLATTMDDTARLRGRQTLQVPVARGQRVRVELDGQGVEVDEPVQELVWRGEPNVAAFSCAMPSSFARPVAHPVARLFVDEVPVGRVLFVVRADVGPSRSRPDAVELQGREARRYKRAFLSYSKADRAEVLKRAQALKLANIDFFLDVHTLEAGEEWEKRLHQFIDDADLFLLFWSRSSRASQWVAKEIEYARRRQRVHPERLPDIVPVVLDDPRDAPPPEVLGDRHFNDTIAALIAYEEKRPKGTGGFLSRWFGRG